MMIRALVVAAFLAGVPVLASEVALTLMAPTGEAPPGSEIVVDIVAMTPTPSPLSFESHPFAWRRGDARE